MGPNAVCIPARKKLSQLKASRLCRSGLSGQRLNNAHHWSGPESGQSKAGQPSILGNADAHNRVSQCGSHLVDFVGGVLRIATSIVEKEADVTRVIEYVAAADATLRACDLAR